MSCRNVELPYGCLMKIHVIYVPFAYIASALGKTFPFAQKTSGPRSQLDNSGVTRYPVECIWMFIETRCCTSSYNQKNQHGPRKMMVGRWVSSWDCQFLGAMLNFGGVVQGKYIFLQPQKQIWNPSTWHFRNQHKNDVKAPIFEAYWICQ